MALWPIKLLVHEAPVTVEPTSPTLPHSSIQASTEHRGPTLDRVDVWPMLVCVKHMHHAASCPQSCPAWPHAARTVLRALCVPCPTLACEFVSPMSSLSPFSPGQIPITRPIPSLSASRLQGSFTNRALGITLYHTQDHKIAGWDGQHPRLLALLSPGRPDPPGISPGTFPFQATIYPPPHHVGQLG
jgi:hypothetical protein